MKNHADNEPRVPDWASLSLGDAWPDLIDFSRAQGWCEIWRAFSGKKPRAVELPDTLLTQVKIPKYVLQEFHNLPNGNYSRRFSRGYVTGFDIAMLGHMRRTRQWIARQLSACDAVLDVGTAGGRTAAAIKQNGSARVWGLDPSPYLLQHAAATYKDIDFIPGIAEDLPFTDNRLDGIALCFVLHEMPPKYIRQAFKEFFRVLQPGGRVVIAEPSPRQLQPFRWRQLLRPQGWAQMYFKCLAQRVYEPFVESWHELDKNKLLCEAGFVLLKEQPGMPTNCWVAQKPL